jgi:hypothetical protein
VAYTQWQSDVDTRWADGSVMCSFVTFAQSFQGSGSVTVDFVNDTNACHLGSVANCQAAALDKNGMLGFNSSGWDAQIDTTGIVASVNARAMLTSLAPQYYLRGPLATQVIVGETDRNFDFGADSYKSLHPIWVLTFWTGQPSVKVEAILEGGVWTDAIQDQTYGVTVKTGAAQGVLSNTIFTKASFRHWAKARWRVQGWTGATPSALNIDYNFEHLKWTRLIPNYDPKRSTSQAQANALVTSFNNGDQAAIFSNGINGNSGATLMYQPSTGGRGELGYLTQWEVAYLYSMNTNLWNVIAKQADMQGYHPLHFREAASLAYLDADDNGVAETGSAQGRWPSIDARPTTNLAVYAPVAALTASPWTIDSSHTPNLTYLPWIIAGDWYWRQETQAVGAYYLAIGNPGTISYGRHGNWGILPVYNERYHAWPLRHAIHAAVVSAPGSLEKAYFTSKINKNIEVMEGFRGIANGTFYHPNPGGTSSNPCPNYNTNSATPWCFGYVDVSQMTGSTLYSPNGADNHKNPLHFIGICGVSVTTDGVDTTKATGLCSPWQYNYVLVVHGAGRDLGFGLGPTLDWEAQHMISMIKNPAFNPYLTASYRIPVTGPPPSFAYFTDWTSVRGGWLNNQTGSFGGNLTNWPPTQVGSQGGYVAIAYGASSFITPYTSFDGYSGLDARAWMEANALPAIANDGNNMWIIAPRPVETSSSGPAGSSSGSSGGGSTTQTTPTPTSGPPVAESVVPAAGEGQSQRFSFTVSDSLGSDRLTGIAVIIGTSTSAASSCRVSWDRNQGTVSLSYDNWASGATPLTVGSTGVAVNSQCTLRAASSTVQYLATKVVLTLDVSFAAQWFGDKNVYLYTSGTGGNSSWQQVGTWKVLGGIVSADAVTPASGSGMSPTMSFTVSDSMEASNLKGMAILITSGPPSNKTQSCYLVYDVPTATIGLYDDNAQVLNTKTVGSSANLMNSSCAVGYAVKNSSGRSMTLQLNLVFFSGFQGNKHIYLAARAQDTDSGWVWRGMWTVQ